MVAVSQFHVSDWLTLILNGLFGIFAIFLAFSLSYFECCNQILERNPKITRFLRSLCISASIFAVIHHLGVISSYFFNNNENLCTAFGYLWLTTYTIGLLGTYIFLWTRQHTINTKAISHLSCLRQKLLLFLSWTTLVILILGIVMVFLAGSRLIFFSNCSEEVEEEGNLKLYQIILSGILLSLTVIGQSQLLALFVIPLMHQGNRMSKYKNAAPIRKRVPSIKTRQTNANILLVKRCIVATVICVIFDVTAAIITISVQHPIARLIYDFNLLCNVSCCVFSFQHWRRMLVPCGQPAPTRPRPSTSSTDLQTPLENMP